MEQVTEIWVIIQSFMNKNNINFHLNSPAEMDEYSEFHKGNRVFDRGMVDDFRYNRDFDPLLRNVSLIIPAYNEENRIGPFLDQLSKELPRSWEVIIVCDGDDRTADIAREKDIRYKVLEYRRRLGKGGAILEGFRAASGDIVGYVDADGAISVREIIRVFSSISDNCDVAVGSRWLRGSRVTVPQPLLRVILGRLYHYMAFALLGIKTKDTQCGLKAFKTSVLAKVLSGVTLKNLSFDTAILYHCYRVGSRISEVPITWGDVDGSKVKPVKTALIMFSSLVGLRLAHSDRHRTFDNLLDSLRRLLEHV